MTQTYPIIPASTRGHTQIGWLNSYHSFSFGEYYNPNAMGHGVLRVLNDDTITGGAGFSPHGHRDMEIISYVLEGGLAHRDSTGGEGVIRPDDLQVMTAGTGVTHSEYNASETENGHFLQLWLLPKAKGLTPRYAQKQFAVPVGWQELAAPVPTQGGIPLHANASIWRAHPAAEGEISVFDTPNGGWLQVTRGSITLPDATLLNAGDALALDGGATPVLLGSEDAEVLLVKFEA